MDNSAFPRVMQRGVLRGRSFQDAADYQRALKDLKTRGEYIARRSPRTKDDSDTTTVPVKTGTYRIEVRTATMHMVVEGSVNGNVQDNLLDAIAKLPV